MLLSTERLLLREFIPEDVSAVLAYQADPRYLRLNPWVERTEDEVAAFIETFLSWQRQEPRFKFQFAIILKSDGQLIGNCGLRKEHPDGQQADLGYELAPDHWGLGYASEAAQAVVTFGFTTLQLHRIWASCLAENHASRRVLEKQGMRLEGRLREDKWMKGSWWDTLIFALLDYEWRQLHPNLFDP